MWTARQMRKCWDKCQALRRETGSATAIEFGLIAFPFIFLLFAILETAYLFLLWVIMEGAAADSARQVRTGVVQNSGSPSTKFQTLMCEGMLGLLPSSCSDLVYDVRNFSNFTGITPSAAPTSQGSATFAPGDPGAVVVVRVVYKWTFMTPLLESLVGGSARYLVSSVAFRNEPFEPPTP